MSPRANRSEVAVRKIAAAGVPRWERGRWLVPVRLHLADRRVLAWKVGRRSLASAEGLVAQCPIEPGFPVWATVARGQVVALRAEGVEL